MAVNRRGLLVLVIVGIAALSGQASAASDSNYPLIIRQVIALLPQRPVQVRVIDVNDARPEDRDNLLKLQAFVLRGSPVIYLTTHGEVLREAVKGSRFHNYMLATVIWHEMAHVEGADETEARRREEALWTRFMLDHAVEQVAALTYLSALKKRRPLNAP
jgi:hypothetical protein